MPRLLALTLLVFSLGLPGVAQADLFTPQPVYTSSWGPYVNPVDEELGIASRVVQLAFYQMGHRPQWEQLDYYFSYNLVKQGEILTSFPYFRTPQREQEVLFSTPLLEVESGLLYSTRWNQLAEQSIDLTQPGHGLRIGKVAGYSYGRDLTFVLAGAEVYNSEPLALQALARGDIDILPISLEVAEQLILDQIPHYSHEIKVLEGYRFTSEMHLIAPKTQQGAAFIEQFDQAMAALRQDGLLDQVLAIDTQVYGTGFVQLLPSEGFPVITGHNYDAEGQIAYYLIPQNSRAVVLQWDNMVLQPHASPKLFDSMMNYSLVRVLNGPHAGRELYVRNMHIGIE